jgi:NitT/TauT family transport system substrate-binding protein
MKRKSIVLLLLAGNSGCLILGACAPKQPAEEPTFRLALLPILDALPIHVAQKEGYFAEEGVKVEFVPVSSAAERDQIIAAGQADGMINDLVSTLLYNQETPQIRIVSFSRVATPDFPQYRILAAGNSGLSRWEDLKASYRISEASVIAYTTDRLLKLKDLRQMKSNSGCPKIPIAFRCSNLVSEAANLPDRSDPGYPKRCCFDR